MTSITAFVWNKNSYYRNLKYDTLNSGSETVMTEPLIPLIDNSPLTNLKTTLVVNTNYFNFDKTSTVQETYSFETFIGTQSIGNLFIIVSYIQPINPENPNFTDIPSLSAYVSSKGIYTQWNNTLGILFFDNKTGERRLQLTKGLIN